MSLAIRFMFVMLCVACSVNVANARQATEQKTPATAAKRNENQTPKKANERPVAAPAAEPFDKAPVERMAGRCVRLETEAGAIELEMLAEAAPESVRNFLNLTATGAYDTTTFSRVVRGFIIQGGNLATRQKLTPELLRRANRTVPDEPNVIKLVRGIASMARTDEPNSATTHFFILVGDAPHLDGTFTAFGRVVRGMEVVDEINKAPVKGEEPEKPVRLTRATVVTCAPVVVAPQNP